MKTIKKFRKKILLWWWPDAYAWITKRIVVSFSFFSIFQWRLRCLNAVSCWKCSNVLGRIFRSSIAEHRVLLALNKEVLVGRSDGDLTVDDRSVSRRHAKLSIQHGPNESQVCASFSLFCHQRLPNSWRHNIKFAYPCDDED